MKALISVHSLWKQGKPLDRFLNLQIKSFVIITNDSLIYLPCYVSNGCKVFNEVLLNTSLVSGIFLWVLREKYWASNQLEDRTYEIVKINLWNPWISNTHRAVDRAVQDT